MNCNNLQPPCQDLPKMGKIYKATNLINGKLYIGKTKRSVEIRMREHLNSKNTIGFEGALKKYGIENFSVDIIEKCPLEQLDEREKYWIAFFDCKSPKGYNLTDGGEGLVNPSQETLDKMSANHADVKGEKNPNYGKPRSEKTKAKISANHADVKGEKNPHYGKPHTAEARAKISANLPDMKGEKHPRYGKTHTAEAKAKMSASHKALWAKRKAAQALENEKNLENKNE